MQSKWLVGLSLLLGAALLVFRKMKLAVTNKDRRARTIRSNNPFALIQIKPDNWQGLIGADPDGFLKFKEVKWGVRAGYINLVNTYINRGLNTLAKIFPLYAPDSVGNNSKAYIDSIVKITGIDPNRTLLADDVYVLGRAIEQIEAGKKWVDAEEWDEGFKLAAPRLKIKGQDAFKKAVQRATANAGNVAL